MIPDTIAGRLIAVSVACVAVVATLGEGGGSATGLLGWHVPLAVCLAAVALTPGAAGSHRLGTPAPAIAFGAFLIPVALGAIRAPYFYAWLLAAIELAACVAVAVLAARAGPFWSSRVAPVLAGAGTLQAIWFLVQRFGQGAERPAGTFLNPNHLGGWLAMVLLVVTATRPKTRHGRMALIAVTGVMGIALILVASRGAWLALAAGVAWRVAQESRRVTPRVRWLGVSGAIAMLLVAGWFVGRRVQADTFSMHRLHIWRASWSQLGRDPFWGTGLGQFPVAAASSRFDDEREPFRYDRGFTATHSDWIRVPVELGLPAAGLFGVALVLGVGAVVRRRREPDWPRAADGAVAALVGLGVQAMVDNPSRWPAAYVLASALAGSLLGSAAREERRWPFRARAAMGAVCLVAWLAADVGPTVAWLETRSLPRGRLDGEQLQALGRATGRNPIHPDLWLRRAEHFAAVDGSLESYAAAREAAERAVRLQPADARFRWGLARIEGAACLELLRDRATCERAAEAFEEAFARSPYDPRILLAAAEFRLAMGDAREAARLAERALRLEPNAAVARLLLAEALLTRGPGSASRASRLVEEATRLAVEYRASVGENRYSAQLLALDPARRGRIRAGLADGRQREKRWDR